MRADYQVFLYTPQGQPWRAPLDAFTRLEYVNRLNGPGYISLAFGADELPAGTDLEHLAVDARAVVWRKPEGLLNAIDFTGLLRKPELSLRGQALAIEATGYGYGELLGRRIVAYDAGSSEADKSGAADTVIGELWDENLGAGAGAGRDITGLGFDIGPILGTGTNVDVAFSRKNVLDAMMKVALQSRATMSTAVYFGFVPLEEGLSARFDVRVGKWGQDLREKLIFGVDYGNMTNPVYTVDRRDELTVVYCAGQGREDERMEGTPQESDRQYDSPLNRREGLFDGRNYKVVANLENAAREKLEEAGIIRTLAFDVTEIDTCRYGLHWKLGDLAQAVFTNIKRDYMITGVQKVVAGGEENVTAILEEYVE